MNIRLIKSHLLSFVAITALLCIQDTQAGHSNDDDLLQPEGLPLRKRAQSPNSSSESDQSSSSKKNKSSDDSDEQIVIQVKFEPEDGLEEVVLPSILTRDVLEGRLRYINPAVPVGNVRRRPTENCLQCCASFLNWVNTGKLVQADPKPADKPNIFVRPQSAHLWDEDVARAIPSHAVEIFIDDVDLGDGLMEYAHVDPKKGKTIHFEPCSFDEFTKELEKIPLREGAGGRFAAGLLSLGYLEENIDKTGITGHFLNFYIYEKNGNKHYLIIDPQTNEIKTSTKFVKSERKFYKPDIYVWWDRNGQQWNNFPTLLKPEPSNIELAEEVASLPVDELEGSDRDTKRQLFGLQPEERVKQPIEPVALAQPQQQPMTDAQVAQHRSARAAAAHPELLRIIDGVLRMPTPDEWHIIQLERGERQGECVIN